MQCTTGLGGGGSKRTHPRLGLANSCLVGEGTAVAVDDASELSLSLSPMGCIVEPPAGCSGIMGASGGSLAIFALAKDFCSSLMGELSILIVAALRFMVGCVKPGR